MRGLLNTNEKNPTSLSLLNRYAAKLKLKNITNRSVIPYRYLNDGIFFIKCMLRPLKPWWRIKTIY